MEIALDLKFWDMANNSRCLIRRLRRTILCAAVLFCADPLCRSQTNPELLRFFDRNIGLSADQITLIRNGSAVSKALPSRSPGEIFLFGAVHVDAAPENYLQAARDFNRRRTLSSHLGLGVVNSPPISSDFVGFSFDHDEIADLRRCKPGNCQIQLPGELMGRFQEAIDWSASDVDEQANRLVQKEALQFLLAYQREGNSALGTYNDKRNATEVSKQFGYLLSYYEAFPNPLPDFFRYLLAYPQEKPANAEDIFYWSKVKFGLKPTLRIVHLVTISDQTDAGPVWATAEKQLYSSHYFQTALDLTFCIPDSNNEAKRRGFYLIKVMGSEQAGLTGFKGSIVRNVAVGRSVSSLQKSLTAIKSSLEGHEEKPGVHESPPQ